MSAHACTKLLSNIIPCSYKLCKNILIQSTSMTDKAAVCKYEAHAPNLSKHHIVCVWSILGVDMIFTM